MHIQILVQCLRFVNPALEGIHRGEPSGDWVIVPRSKVVEIQPRIELLAGEQEVVVGQSVVMFKFAVGGVEVAVGGNSGFIAQCARAAKAIKPLISLVPPDPSSDDTTNVTCERA